MKVKLQSLYRDLAPLFEAAEEVVDIQSDFMERLELLAVACGTKSSFYCLLEDPGREVFFRAVAARLGDEEVFQGFNDATVHHRYRPLKIARPELETIIEARASETLPIYWVTRDERLATIYRSGRVHDHDDHEMLDYPACCSAWHFDTYFARPMEAFCDVYLKREAPEEIAAFLSKDWHPEPGWFLPKMLFAGALFRSNRRYPFIPHFACPQCLSSPDSPSARQHRHYSELALEIDPELHAKVVSWTEGLDRRIRQILDHARDIVAREGAELGFVGPALDAYERHSRYLLRALGLAR